MSNIQVQLARQPEGNPKATDFQVVKTAMPKAGPGQFLARNIYLSLDPYMRGAIAGRHMGHQRLNPGDVIYGRCLAEVMESQHADYKAGDYVVLESGWQQFYVSDGAAADEVRKIDAGLGVPLSAHLGALGMPGLTAWAGVEKLANPGLGSTFVVSAAAGPVGGTAGQIAKAKGARAVGIAGSDEKCRIVVNEYGFDACVNYKNKNWTEELKAACPNGVDTYFDNVGGPMLDAVTQQLNLYGKIVLCGLVSQYNRGADSAFNGHNLGPFVGKRAQLLGLVVYDYYARMNEFLKAVVPLVNAKRLKFHEDRADSIEKAPEHFVRLMSGQNTGKALVVIGPEKA
ncbi:MAG: NADP-dependent oxidoreductase [Rhodospirillaceae bacterium]|nr:NADP-dependent oxidoreductase [Rhodospirillaceae bacterium]